MPLDKREKQWRAIKRFDQQNMRCCTQALAKQYHAKFPDHGAAWFRYGISLYAVARYSEALAALRRAARLCPPNKLHLVQYHFGHLYQQRGSYRRAEPWFRRAIASCPSHSTSYIYLGALLALEGRLAEAEVVHRQATLCKEGCIDEAFLNLGLVLRALERYSDTRKCFQRALAIDPKYKEAAKELTDVERVIKLNRNACHAL